MPSNNVHFIKFYLTTQLDRLFLATIPSLRRLVISWTTLGDKSNSAAICRLDRFSPMKYRHSIHTRSGWWCPSKIVFVRSSNCRPQSPHSYRCLCCCLVWNPRLFTLLDWQPGHSTPSGQRSFRTASKHFSSSIRCWILIIPLSYQLSPLLSPPQNWL